MMLRPKVLCAINNRNLSILTFDARGLKFKSTVRKYRNLNIYIYIYISRHMSAPAVEYDVFGSKLAKF